ncbi:translation initiation factor IF-2 [Thermococcus kodakarensis KOD1]|uniref:Probable translation initiation factor IF-2 n=1 Tax=Thermococcus kodakarensis (strain ATCC BAA-918 / JCM 12380 / KOD1) TaxID=69014 RepID=IF2P_THEKO|nr:intein-containing translation initiation factor aIF-2 [Thermococcus kodakarensis]Q5JGR9.1 RecName: Full=Probable translation initiation factor IF-2; Contains: RecName: Full=Pko infB intein; AltName: Full=Pko IF2 intein [Thermococcus kodakarensis KOD1]WCN29323.1 intein-containing translation initiation factor aIF-2 [Thermococcus kodakarensis]WCN29581.1 intein-containing translation initiation factor aIF-2 [Thermococcus kodakarensis]BAD85494.1 translation initiation factor IF-2 [Thermococcus k
MTKRIRQPIIAVLGHVDHGKCLLPDEKVILPEHGPITLKGLFDLAKETVVADNEKEIRKLGAKLTIVGEDGRLRVLESPYVWKVRHRGKMLRVKLKNWHSVSVTPEHPFLTTRGWVRADQLKPGDYVAVPRVIHGNESDERFVSFVYEKLKNDELIAKLRGEVLSKISSEFKGDRAYKVERNVFRWEDIERLNLWDEVERVAFTPRMHRSGKPLHYVKLPRSPEEWEAFFYFAGVMFGDGSQDKIANNDVEVYEELKKLSVLGVAVKRVERTTSYEIELTNGKNALLRLLRVLFEYPERQKAKSIRVPRILFIAPRKYVSRFLRGYFDADGHVSLKDARIEVTSASQEFLEDLSLLLLRFGIVSKIYRSDYTTLVISGRRNLDLFRRYIGFSVKNKAEALEKAIKKSRRSESYPIFEELKRLRLLFGFTRTELNSNVPFYGKYESEEAPSYETLMRILDAIEKGSINLDKKIAVLEGRIRDHNYIKAFEKDGLIKDGKLTELGRELLEVWRNREFDSSDVDYIRNLAENLVFIPVEDIEEFEYEGYVYDVTTETHNFVANGILVHNTTLLDRIRHTNVAGKEAGGITQHIGATEVPIDVVKQLAGPLIKLWKGEIKLPGLLFIDTPGHEAFTSLRARGGSLADLAVLVVDINEGFQPQTIESIEILRRYRTPFIVAANKIDRIKGWVIEEDEPFLVNIKKQDQRAIQELETKLWELIGKFYEMGFNANRFDRVQDFTRELAIVPISAKYGIGIPELLVLIAGLSQKYLEEKLKIEVEGPARGTILEVREEVGLGTTIDVIIYDGTLRKDDTIVVGGKDKAIVTKIRALLKPKPLDEIRDPRFRFDQVDEVTAAAGVKIAAPGLEEALAGSPVIAARSEEEIEKAKQEILSQIQSVVINTGKIGVIVKADTLGSLEALSKELQEKGIPIRKADVGNISKTDVMEALSVKEEEPKYGVVLGFNVKVNEDAEEVANAKGVPIFVGNIIYKLIEDYEAWVKEEEEKRKRELLKNVTFPGVIRLYPDERYVFRRSKPAIVGVEVLEGRIRPGVTLIKETGEKVGVIKSIKNKNDFVQEAKKGDAVAIAIEGAIVGRHIHPGETLYVDLSKNDVIILAKQLKDELEETDIKALKMTAKVKAKEDPFWRAV